MGFYPDFVEGVNIDLSCRSAFILFSHLDHVTVDCYKQRVDACKDESLKAILAHNRDEEKEHAAMVLEWIRRKDPRFNKELKEYLFTDTAIAHEQPDVREIE